MAILRRAVAVLVTLSLLLALAECQGGYDRRRMSQEDEDDTPRGVNPMDIKVSADQSASEPRSRPLRRGSVAAALASLGHRGSLSAFDAIAQAQDNSADDTADDDTDEGDVAGSETDTTAASEEESPVGGLSAFDAIMQGQDRQGGQSPDAIRQGSLAIGMRDRRRHHRLQQRRRHHRLQQRRRGDRGRQRGGRQGGRRGRPRPQQQSQPSQGPSSDPATPAASPQDDGEEDSSVPDPVQEGGESAPSQGQGQGEGEGQSGGEGQSEGEGQSGGETQGEGQQDGIDDSSEVEGEGRGAGEGGGEAGGLLGVEGPLGGPAFVTARTAYDYLSSSSLGGRGGGRARSSNQRRSETDDLGFGIGEDLCELFGKHLVRTNIGGRCV